MATINSIDNNLTKIIKDLKPNEMKQYIKFNVNKLYDAFLKHEEKEALASKKAIEDATKLYISEGYENSLSIELALRLEKANELLIETLTEKENLRLLVSEIGIYKIYEKLSFNVALLELISGDQINKDVIKKFVELIKINSGDIKIFMGAIKKLSESEESIIYDPELCSSMLEEYEKFKILLKDLEDIKINN